MKSLLIFIFASTISMFQGLAGDVFIVKDGKTNAQIVIAEKTQRTTRLAAKDLQDYIEKISGAKLEVVTEPSDAVEVKIYVGRSSHTDKLNITADGLKYGAYRIVSGDKWLVLIGDDSNFVPREPWPRNNKDVHGRVTEEWQKMTGEKWGHPLSQVWKRYSGNNGRFGTAEEDLVDKNGNVNVWSYDERGSFNAVSGFLRELGVRWYMPGEIGEVLPQMKTIELDKIDETVIPDFDIRNVHHRFGIHDTAMWAMHLGFRADYDLTHIAHGLALMTNHNEDILKAHPKWFALYGGKRQNKPEMRYNHFCYSSDELVQEAARFARAQFDHLGLDMVSIMPTDGYTSMCQCELCVGRDTPERGYRGRLSDNVWEFVNRVAKEVKKTHPDKMISCCAYGSYTLVPEKIDKLESNIQVIIVGGRRPTSNQPEQQQEQLKIRQDWVKKTDNPLLIYENYPFTDRGWYLPSYVPHAIGSGINATKGISKGEDVWLSIKFDTQSLGYNHFPVYFTQRMYWGGKEKDVDAMFNEYCILFYGPAGKEMKSFFEYCENNWQKMEKDKAIADEALDLFEIAKKSAAADSIYARRMALVDEYLAKLRDKSRQLGEKRGPVPQMRLITEAKSGDIVLDGKLDEEIWNKNPYTGRLRELQTSQLPIFGTTFKAAWGADGSIYFAIRCDERSGEPLNVGTTKNGDSAIWYGDVIEILLETDSHSYYQIAINPAGAVVDLDRSAPGNARFAWHSRAEVATQVEDGSWTVEVRIPVVQDENDPLNQVIGSKPLSTLPWHFNVCRQRLRGQDKEFSAFSPTGASGFHKPLKFAHLFKGLSHQFPFSALQGDYLVDNKAAIDLMKKRKFEQALQAFVAIAGREVSDLQKSAALKQAAGCARKLKDYRRAEELAEQIPLQVIAKTAQMENGLAQRKSKELVEQFGKEDMEAWPFWQIGEGAYLRGQAYAVVGDGTRAEMDYKAALEFTTERQVRTKILRSIGNNREKNLKDQKAALKAYQQLMDENSSGSGYSEYLGGVQAAARILRDQKKYDESLIALRHVDESKLRGSWKASMLYATGETLAAAGRKDEALKAFRAVIADKAANKPHHKKAQEAIKSLQGK
ncbi:MAG: DUF4838 domain-containing protein [Verrucomicrobiota bacterium]